MARTKAGGVAAWAAAIGLLPLSVWAQQVPMAAPAQMARAALSSPLDAFPSSAALLAPSLPQDVRHGVPLRPAFASPRHPSPRDAVQAPSHPGHVGAPLPAVAPLAKAAEVATARPAPAKTASFGAGGGAGFVTVSVGATFAEVGAAAVVVAPAAVLVPVVAMAAPAEVPRALGVARVPRSTSAVHGAPVVLASRFALPLPAADRAVLVPFVSVGVTVGAVPSVEVVPVSGQPARSRGPAGSMPLSGLVASSVPVVWEGGALGLAPVPLARPSPAVLPVVAVAVVPALSGVAVADATPPRQVWYWPLRLDAAPEVLGQ